MVVSADFKSVMQSGRPLQPEWIGRTPLIAVRGSAGSRRDRRVSVKLEAINPSGSSKDRTAYRMLHDWLPQLDRSKARIIESSSGNLAVAMAWQCRDLGVTFTAVVDPRTTSWFASRLAEFGAEIITVAEADPHGNYLEARISTIERICARDPALTWLNQYANPSNPAAHFTGTAQEIHRQAKGGVGTIIVPVSTGGTAAGVAGYFREFDPTVRVLGVDIDGSAALGGSPGPRVLSGIGATRPSHFLKGEKLHGHIYVPCKKAIGTAWDFTRSTGVALGPSTGAALTAALELDLDSCGERGIAIIAPDLGDRYADTFYNAEWLQRVGLDGATTAGAWFGVDGDALESR